MNRARSIWCVVMSLVLVSAGCGSSPASPTVTWTLAAGRYQLLVNIWDGSGPSILAAVFTPCPAATESASIGATTIVTAEAGKWHGRPETAADGTFDLWLEPAPGVLVAKGTLSGTLAQSAGTRTVRIGDGTTPSPVTGMIDPQGGIGDVQSGVAFSLGSRSFSCGEKMARWDLHRIS